MNEKTAVIDIGSNTIRLVIFEKSLDGRQFKEIETIKRAARLRNYLNAENLLTGQGITKLIDTLKSFQRLLALYKVTEIICVATATLRQAENRERIIKIVEEKTGFTVNILSEYEEAYYGYLAVVHSIDIPEGLTIDMGGGSTELTYFREGKLLHYASLPFGSLSLKFQFVKGDIPDKEELRQIRQYVQVQIEKVPWIKNKRAPIIAMGGSARTVARLHQSYVRYPLESIHQYVMDISDIVDLKERIARLSFIHLQNLESLSKDRTDTILPAIEVFDILCNFTKASRFILSRKGLREGLLLKNSVLTGDFPSMADSNIHELMQDYHLDLNRGQQLSMIAAMIFKQVKAIKGIGNGLSDNDLELLKRGAHIFHLGKYINEESSSYTFYLLTNRTIGGLSHQERVKLALVASYKGRGAFRKYIEPFKNWYSKEERKKLALLGVILKLSQSLNTLERNIVRDIKITHYEDRLVMNILCQDFYAPEQYQLEKQKKHFEKIVKTKLVPEFHLKSF